MKTLFSLILGAIIGYIVAVFYISKDKNLHGPNSKLYLNKIIKENNKCYICKPRITVCPLN